MPDKASIFDLNDEDENEDEQFSNIYQKPVKPL